MRILIVGDWHSELHEEVVFSALDTLGHELLKFAWHSYFESTNKISNFNKKLQNKFITGPIIRKINQDLLGIVLSFSPDMVFVYRGTHIISCTLKKIKQKSPKTILIGYNNDDPFAKGHPYSLWKHFFSAVPMYDLMLAYRQKNIDELYSVGAKRVELLRSWYYSERNFPVTLSFEDENKYGCDVVFVGHYEADDRKHYLEILRKNGVKLNLFGPGYDWDPVIEKSPELKPLMPINLVWGEEYNKALCGAKIALCFLSKLNSDTYTRRCFEIPATRTMMFSEYTDDLASLFEEGKEVEFFRNKKEFLEKIKFYLANDTQREAVAKAGYNKVCEEGHDVISRMSQVLIWVDEIKEKQI